MKNNPPYCMLCGSKNNWNSDFDCEDYGFDVEGIVGVYTCSHCETTHSIIDVFFNDSQPRVIKCDVNQEFDNSTIYNQEVSNCLLCSGKLDVVSREQKGVKDILMLDALIENSIITTYKCSECNNVYVSCDIISDNECSLEDKTIYIDSLPSEAEFTEQK